MIEWGGAALIAYMIGGVLIVLVSPLAALALALGLAFYAVWDRVTR